MEEVVVPGAKCDDISGLGINESDNICIQWSPRMYLRSDSNLGFNLDILWSVKLSRMIRIGCDVRYSNALQ